MIPSARLVLLLAALALAAVLLAFGLVSPVLWQVAVAVTVGVALADLLWGRREPLPEVRRHLPGSLPVGVHSRIELAFRNAGERALRLRVFDHYPAECQCDDFPARMTLPPGRWTQLRYRVLPVARGEHSFALSQCRIGSPLGLWWRDCRLGAPSPVRVYPNFAAVAKYALLAHEQRLPVIGVQKQRRRGEGSEFHQLREFRPGDSLTQIDWRATARTRKIIAREYQDERNQTVLFLLDCGRRMRAQDGALSHFDQALNAVLLMAYVALRNGDSVGVSTFAGEGRWLAPAKGQGSLNRILNTLYDLEPSTHIPDYPRASSELLVRQSKRALVVLVTNLRDEDTADLEAAVGVLKRKHLVLLASLRERAVDDCLAAPPGSFDDALTAAAASDYLFGRDRALEGLRNRGVLGLDVLPSELSVQLVNHYLAIKAQGIL